MNIIWYILIWIKYSQTCRNVQTSQINVKLTQCHILRLMSTWWTCHCNLQSNKRGSSVMPYHFIHYLHQAFLHKTICKNFKMYTHIAIYTKKFIENSELKVHVIWLAMLTKCMMLKKCFWGIQKYMYCKKWFLNHINKIPYHRGREHMYHAMSLHPWCIPSMSIVSKLMINHISEKQQKEQRW